jgi:ATP-dependent RNA helicase RhlB
MIKKLIKKLFGSRPQSTPSAAAQPEVTSGTETASGEAEPGSRRRRSRGRRGSGPWPKEGAVRRETPEVQACGPRDIPAKREDRGPPRSAPQPLKPRPAAVDSNAPAYASFNLAAPIMQGITDAGFTHCTPIQAQTLPSALAGRDVAGQAQTGTGKTAAFLVAMFQSLLTRPARADRSPTAIRGIVIAPTRELAVQIHNDALVLGRHTGLRLACVFGGVDYEKQRRQFDDGADILIGTPGRIIDYFKQGVFDLRHVEVVVLDEADRMFDLGFIDDIRYMLRKMPPPAQRQSMLFSATLSQRVLELAYEDMNDPDLVRIEPDRVTADKVRQLIYFPAMEEKIPLLVGLIRKEDAHRTMVFVNTRRMADRLEDVLRANGINAQAISGDVPQNKRLRYLKEFHSGELAVLIATDVASRGLHIPDVSHVYNYDLPQDCADYVHRIGRTARAGAEGDAISFGCEDYAVCLPDIENYIGHKIPVGTIAPNLLATNLVFPKRRPREDEPPRRGGGGGGGRPGGGGRRGPPRGGRR